MPVWYRFVRLSQWVVLLGLAGHMSTAGAHADLPLGGRVVDNNGNPVDKAIVTVYLAYGHGPELTTMFTDEGGTFSTPGLVSVDIPSQVRASVRKLGYEQVHQSYVPPDDKHKADIRLIVRPVTNQAGEAPASAWLSGLESDKRAELIRTCVGCHQMPNANVRDYARLIEESITGLSAVDPEDVRRQSWTMIEQYMAVLADDTMALPEGKPSQQDFSVPLAGGTPSAVAEILAGHFIGPMSGIESYDYGAPVLGIAQTVINEYRLRDVDRVRGAVLLGSPPRLWTTDSGANNVLISVDLETGELRRFQLPPVDDPVIVPGALQRGASGTLWVTSAVGGLVAQFDTRDEKWLRVWQLKDESGTAPEIHELGLGQSQQVKADKLGNIWFSDRARKVLGHFSPDTGSMRLFTVPETPGRSSSPSPSPYAGPGGVFIGPDGQFAWFSQPGNGAIGALDTESFKFRTVALQDAHAAPQGMTMNGADTLYVPLFGTGQLLEYNASTGEQTAHDLPDRASAPTTATYDPIRNAVWIATLNGDSIYRFDPATGEFALLPFPRQGTYLKDLSLNPESGILAGLYSDSGIQDPILPMLVTIEIGDRAYPEPVVGTSEEGVDDAK